MTKPVTLADFLAQASAKLADTGCNTPQLDARFIIMHGLGIDRTAMMSHSDRLLTTEETHRLNGLLARRCLHEPVGRILGEREFWGLTFRLNEATLEPRPDSETLVEVVLSQVDKTAPLRLLDLGTGTGCLLLSILHELPNATGIGVDVASRAVEQATSNAEALNLADRATFLLGNWFNGISESFDVIISNPPYIPSSTIPTLMPEVRHHDPMRALDGGEDGLEVYRYLIPLAPKHLKANGLVIFEVGQGQADDVIQLCRDAGLTHITTHKDLAEIERCVMGRKA